MTFSKSSLFQTWEKLVLDLVLYIKVLSFYSGGFDWVKKLDLSQVKMKFILIWVIFFFIGMKNSKFPWIEKTPLHQWGTPTCLLPLYKEGWLYLNDKIKVDVKGNRTGKSQLRQKICESAFIKRSTQRLWSFFICTYFFKVWVLLTQPNVTLFLSKSIWTRPQGSQGCQKIRIVFFTNKTVELLH